MSKHTPTYIASCPECGQMVGAAVADLESEVILKSAISAKKDFEKNRPLRHGRNRG